MDIKLLSQVKSYEDVCKHLNRTPLTLEHFAHLPESQREAAFSRHKVESAFELANGDWKANYSNNERKYTCWFVWDGSAGRFVYLDYAYARTVTDVGARLSTDTWEKAEYIGKTFEDDFNKFLQP